MREAMSISLDKRIGVGMKDPKGLSFSFLCAIAALRETHYSHARCAQAAEIAKDQSAENLTILLLSGTRIIKYQLSIIV
jgi:hypothetical protein